MQITLKSVSKLYYDKTYLLLFFLPSVVEIPRVKNLVIIIIIIIIIAGH